MDLPKLAIVALIIMLSLFACKGKPDGNEGITPEDGQSEYTPDAVEPGADPDSDADLSPLQNYQYTWSEDDDMPPVVIIIDDFGNSAGKLLEDFADLPDEVVFAVLPDLPHTETASKLAHKKGHEVIITFPCKLKETR